MARTVLGYFGGLGQAERFVKKVIEGGHPAELINIIYKDFKAAKDQKGPGFDPTIEAAPVAEYREALFEADITEEDAEYYQSEVDKGRSLVSVFFPTGFQPSRQAEENAANRMSEMMRTSGAYDREIRQVFSNRGMTTYPQNRFMDPAGMLNTKDRIYRSASPLNEERSTTVGVADKDETVVETEKASREVVSGLNLISQFASAEAELLQQAREKTEK
jgi:hypothetical protein